MKLSKLYSNQTCFKSISFNKGIGSESNVNIILAKVKAPKSRDKDSHNLGKTTLIYILDFLLLKKRKKTDLFYKLEDTFAEYTFFLELLLNDGSYLTIKRSVLKNTRISLKHHHIPHQHFVDEKVWDASDIPIDHAVELLQEAFNFDVLKNWPYRKSLTYFLRSQHDYRDIFQLSKFAKGKDQDWKPFMFDLLGFDGALLREKYDLETDKTKLENVLSESKNRLALDPGELDKIRGAILIKKDERDQLNHQIEDFRFFEHEQSSLRELVDEIERRVAYLNTQVYELEYEISQINHSLQQAMRFDLKHVKQIFAEASLFFPDNLVKDYAELEAFNRQVTEEREHYLEERLGQIHEELKAFKTELITLDQKRSQLLSHVTQTQTFKKYKAYQRELSDLEVQITRFEEQEKNIDILKKITLSISELDNQIERVVAQIDEQIMQVKSKVYPHIRKLFSEFFKEVTHSSALIYIQQNGKGNVDFQEAVHNQLDVLTAKDKGTSYKKFLCIAFDLAVLSAYSERSFFKFVYHDGALEGLDDRKKHNFLELVASVSRKYNIQYIFSTIEHDLPRDLKTEHAIDPKHVVLALDDSGDEGTLFGLRF